MRSSLPVALSVFILSFAGGCSSPDAPTEASDSEYTGTSGSEVVKPDGSNLPANLQPLRGAIAKVTHLVSFEGGAGACTGTHVGNGLVLTAGHCFRRDWQTGMVYRRTPREDDGPFERINVQFEDGKNFTATMLDWALTMQDDYAILRLEGDELPSAAIPIRQASTAPAYGTKLTMLSYPDGRRREGRDVIDDTTLIWSKYCTYDDSSGEVDDFHMVDVAHGRFAHQCFSAPGSSGAVLIDATTLEVVGIHNGYVNEANFGMQIANVPWHQYVDALAEPAAKLNVAHDDGFSSDKSADATVDVPAGSVESVAFELIDRDPGFTTQPPAQIKVTSAPFTAHFDTSALEEHGHGLRAVVTGKNGASLVLEDSVMVRHP
jgi:hypothetical protein